MTEIIITEFMDEAACGQPLAALHTTLYDPKLVDDLHGSPCSCRKRGRSSCAIARRCAARCWRPGRKLSVVAAWRRLDNIDVAACAEHGIRVIPATGANDLSVAEWVISTAMILLRGAYHSTDAVIAGGWPRNKLMGRELSGRIMGLVGFGAIAREVAKRARALGMDVMAHDPFVADHDPAWSLARPHGLEPLLREADVISLHVPLTEETRNMIDALRITACAPTP